MIVKIYTDRMAEIIVEEATEVPDAMDLVLAMTESGITAAKIVKSNPATGRPGTQVAHNTENCNDEA